MSMRYKRQEAIEGIGAEGQARLRKGSVMVIGCGALGSLVSMYLSGAGIGRIGIADFDTIDVSNLQRQLFFAEREAGMPKSSVLAKRLTELNSETKVEEYRQLISRKNGLEILGRYDIIIDATDNPASKYTTDALSEELGKPCCIGGVEEMRGQIITILPGDERYVELFPDLPDDPGLTPCSVSGVLGPVAGVVASLQAAEAIKYISGVGSLCRRRILDFDLRSFRFSSIDF